MSREDKARAGMSRVIPDDTIQDVALVSPHGSTRAGAIGAALGGAIGGQLGGAGVTGRGSHWATWRVSAGPLAGPVCLAPCTLLPAASPTSVYALGRDRLGVVGGWRNLTPLLKIERRHLRVAHRLRGVVMQIDLTDTTTGSTFEVEARPMGNLGVTEFLQNLESTDPAEPD